MLKDTDEVMVECDWMTDLYERNDGEIWVDLMYEFQDKNDKNKFTLHRYERFIGEYGSKHAAISRIREFQQKIQEMES